MSYGGVVDAERVTARLAAYSAALESLLSDDLSDLTAAEAVEFARVWEIQQRRAVVVTHAVMAALGSSGAPGELGYRDAAALLVDVLRVDPGEARGRARAAVELGPQRSFAGEPLAPQFAAIAAAQRQGTISAGHARVIVAALDSLSPQADVAHGEAVQELFVEYAGQFTPRKLKLVADRALAHLDPDGARPSDAEQQRRRTLTLASRPDGSGYLEGRLIPQLLALLRTVLDPLTAPSPSVDGVPDPRTAGQRCHDGLLDLCERAVRWGELPPTGGVPTTLILTMTAADFSAQQGFATTAHGDLVPVRDALSLADQAEVVSVELNAFGGVLNYGRTRRLATPAQRCAVWARDTGCSFPGCTIPAVWTQLHHVLDWLYGGDTAVDNMTAVCGHHHRTFAATGWSVFMREGVPWWVPPSHIDPDQTPIQNQHWKTPNLGV